MLCDPSPTFRSLQLGCMQHPSPKCQWRDSEGRTQSTSHRPGSPEGILIIPIQSLGGFLEEVVPMVDLGKDPHITPHC